MELTFKSGGKILEIGGGNNPLRDIHGNKVTYNIDNNPGEFVDQIVDINIFPFPFEDNFFDGIFSKYCIEHIEWKKIPVFLKECYRILKPNSKLIFFTSNTFEQCKKIVKEGINKNTIEMLFGSQEFPNHGGCHKMAFSPEYAKTLFKEAGFNKIQIHNHPVSDTDMIIETYKLGEELFEREYFEDGTIGYNEYRDFATHYSTARIIQQTGAKSVLDVGAGRGYVAKILENEGIIATAMDVSKHCYMTRATNNFVLHDATQTPCPFEDKQFDLVFSINFLEHIEEKHLPAVIKEMIRVSKGGFHGIHFDKSPFEEQDPDIDISHHTLKPESWWKNIFKETDSDYIVVIKHPRYLEYEKPELNPPITLMPDVKDGIVKLNIGCFKDCFYYGWINIDILDLKDFAQKQAYNFLQHDIRKGLPYKDNSVDLIITNHMIEHINRIEGEMFLKECYRILKPEGILRVSTPDTKLITQQYLDGQIMEYKYINVGVETAKDEAEAYYNLLLAGHKTIYDEKSLIKIMEHVGFNETIRMLWNHSKNQKIKKETITTHPNISLIVEGKK